MKKLITLLSLALSLTSCGRPPETASEAALKAEKDGKKVIGDLIKIGSQCTLGPISDDMPLKLLLIENTNKQLMQLEVEHAPPTLYYQGDCTKRSIEVRNVGNGKLTGYWKLPIDMKKDITYDPGPIILKDDGSGNHSCYSFLQATTSVSVICKKDPDLDQVRDTPTLALETSWTFGQGEKPKDPKDYPAYIKPGTPECKLTGRLYSDARLRQCP